MCLASSVGDVVFHSLGLYGGQAFGVVDGGVDRMLDAGAFFGFFGVIPAVQSAYEIAGDAAQALEFAFIEILGVGIEIFFGGSSV